MTTRAGAFIGAFLSLLLSLRNPRKKARRV
jgi:hypothetical protein